LIGRAIDAEPQLANLVEKYGSNAVWQASMDHLGYPATWSLDGMELIELSRYLERNVK
jgi:hypothetical protein